jgi:hypothetical protein
MAAAARGVGGGPPRPVAAALRVELLREESHGAQCHHGLTTDATTDAVSRPAATLR